MCIQNVEAVLKAAGSELGKVVKVREFFFVFVCVGNWGGGCGDDGDDGMNGGMWKIGEKAGKGWDKALWEGKERGRARSTS